MTSAQIAEDWADLIERFGEHLAAQGRKQSTIVSYRSHLRSLADLVEEGPYQVLPADVELWLEASGGSTRLRRTIGHTFFTWTVTEGLLSESPAPRPMGAMRGKPGPKSPMIAELNRSEVGRRWHAWIIAFGDWQRAANHAARTIQTYRYYLVDLGNAAGCGPEEVATRLLLHQLGSTRWGQETKKSARSAYRTFFTWATDTGRIEASPAEKLPPIRIGTRLARPTPEAVLHRALRHAEEREEFMIRLGAIGGLRACEIARVHDSDWDGVGFLRVLGKGNKVRLVGITDARLVQLLGAVRGHAFPNRWTGKPITAAHVTVLLSRALDETWTGHTLRHRMATQALRTTGDLHAVSRVLGHSSTATTDLIYTRLDDERVMAVAVAAAAAAGLPDYTSRVDEVRVGGLG